jgi:folate-binding protein YgfZ
MDPHTVKQRCLLLLLLLTLLIVNAYYAAKALRFSDMLYGKRPFIGFNRWRKINNLVSISPIMRLYKLPHTVLRLSGNVRKLLDGITSNTLDRPQNAFLDQFGKIIVVVWQCWDSDDLLLVVPNKFSQRLYGHIKRYLQLSDVTVKNSDLQTYWDIDDNYNLSEGDFVISEKKGRVLVTPKMLESSVSNEIFAAFRLENDIPLQGIDYDQEMALNVSEDFVSFTKGCYLGQEVIARVKNLGKPPKKLVVQDKTFVFVRNE